MITFKNSLYYIVFIFSFVIFSCTFSTTRINDKSDQLLAEKVTGQFYRTLTSKSYKNSFTYFSNTFAKKTDTSKLFKFFREYENKTGIINKTFVVSCETKSLKQRDSVYKSFVVIYRVERSIKTTQERFILKSNDNSEPKIYRYDIDDKIK